MYTYNSVVVVHIYPEINSVRPHAAIGDSETALTHVGLYVPCVYGEIEREERFLICSFKYVADHIREDHARSHFHTIFQFGYGDAPPSVGNYDYAADMDDYRYQDEPPPRSTRGRTAPPPQTAGYRYVQSARLSGGVTIRT